MTEVSDGLASFTLSNAEGVGQLLEDLTEGDEFEADVEVSTAFGALRGTIVRVAE